MILIYLLILLIIFLGLYMGLIVGYFAEEELQPGKKYLNLLRHALFIAILVIFFVKNPSWLFIISVALIVIIFSFSKLREILYYYSLALIVFMSWKFNGFSLIAPLAFLYGFPTGSIYLFNHLKQKKNKKMIVLGILRQYAGFLVVGVLLALIGLLL